MTKISVIIPVYKDLKGLRRTVDSLFKQTITDFHIIVVNDGADDSIRKYCEAKKITSQEVSPNKGSYNARNLGIKLATTEFLAFTDADLILDKNWIERGLSYLREYDYVAGNVQIIEEMVSDLATFHDLLTAFPVEEYFNKAHFGVTASLFVKKVVFDLVGLFDAELKSGGDFEFGDRVYYSTEKISQFYANDCIAYHPPRNHQQKKEKILRVWNGRKDLEKKYPHRFPKENLSFKESITAILPPSIPSLKNMEKEGFHYSKWSLYKYLYLLKLYNIFYYLR